MITRRGVLFCGGTVAAIGVRRARAFSSEAQKEFCMDIDIKRNGSRPSQKGPEDWFTGTVRIDPLFQAPDPARAVLARSRSSPAPARPGTRIRSARR
jgi:hypothetical protein